MYNDTIYIPGQISEVQKHLGRKVKLKRLNWDSAYVRDIISGQGFTITEPDVVKLDGKESKTLFGARSPLYGTQLGDEDVGIERCTCDCGHFKGREFEGEECPFCKTKVKQRESNIKMTGWISLHDNYVIAPYYYRKLCDILGKNVMEEITLTKKRIDKDGNIKDLTEKDMENCTHPFLGIGLLEFKKRFFEIMNWFKEAKPKKADEINAIIKESMNVFCSYIPVYSTMLRASSETRDSYYYNSVDKHINPLFSLSDKLKDKERLEPIEQVHILSRVQDRVNSLWNINFSLLDGKEGLIRQEILGGSLNNTSRNVIIPDVTLRANEIDISYYTFHKMFEYKIIYYLMKLNNISLANAYELWEQGHIFNDKMYKTMCILLEKEKLKLLLNRNPTMNFYSLCLMKIRKIKYDPDDYTLSIPSFILSGLNADYAKRKVGGYSNIA